LRPAEPPEFIVDRCLGRRTVAQLRELGWCVHHLGDVYPDDGQDIADEEWIALAAGCSDALCDGARSTTWAA
jgi:hypothetical protein